MTDLRSELHRYLNIRQGFGYNYTRQAQWLSDFVSFMEKSKTTTITTKLAVAWATLPSVHCTNWPLRLTCVRVFARHLASIDPQTEVPPHHLLPPPKRSKPYIYTDAEISALLEAALTLPRANGLQRWTYYYLFGTIAVTGMRLSEIIGLQRSDVNLDDGVITIRRGKFGKSRLLPLHRTTTKALLSYAERRDAHLGPRCAPYFFVAERGGRLLPQHVRRAFWRLSRQTGLRKLGDHTGPRIHDLRHAFAVQTVLRWYRQNINVQQQLPVLSTFLGHTAVRDTYWYLSACPELMDQAVLRLNRRWEAKP
jgi:integrase